MQKSLSGRTDTKQIHRADTDSQTPCLKNGLRVGKYRIEELEAVSAGVSLYSAHDVERGSLIAIKVPDTAIQLDHELLREEVRRVGQLNHRSICPVLHLLTGDSFTGVASPWPAGTQLSKAMPSLSAKTAIDITKELLACLSQAHMVGVAHGGLNPDRIYLDSGRLQIADFGLARVLPPTRSRYTAPDANPIAEPSDDTFSLGVLFGELLLPHIDEFEHQNAQKLRSLLDQMTATRAAARPRSMARVAAELTLLIPGSVEPDVTADALIASLETRLQSEKRARKAAAVKEKPTPACKQHIGAIEKLVSAGRYSAALKKLKEAIKSSEDSTVVAWSREKHSQLRADIKKFEAATPKTLAAAQKLYEQRDLDAALSKINAIPREFHNKGMKQLQQFITQDIEEIELLALQIDSQSKPNDARLIPDLERLLELQPNDEHFRGLLDKLLKQEQRRKHSKYATRALNYLLVALAVSIVVGAGWIGVSKLAELYAEASNKDDDDLRVEPPKVPDVPDRPPWQSTKPSKPVFANLEEVDVNPRSSKSEWALGPDGIQSSGSSILWTTTPVTSDAIIVKPRANSATDLIIGASAKWGASEVADGIRISVSDSSEGSVVVGGIKQSVPILTDLTDESELRIANIDGRLSLKWDGKDLANIETDKPVDGFIGLVAAADVASLRAEGLKDAQLGVHEVGRWDDFSGRILASQQGHLIVQTSRAIQVYDWNSEQTTCEAKLDSSTVRVARVIENGQKLLVVTDRSANIFHTSSGLLARKLSSVPLDYRYMALSPDGSLLSASNGSGGAVTVNIRDDKSVSARNLPSYVREIQFISGRQCAFIEGSHLSLYGATGTRAQRISPTGGGVSLFACNGKNTVVTKSSTGIIEAWSSSGKPLGKLTTEHGTVRKLSIDSEGRYCMATHTGGDFSLWTLADMSLQHDLPPSLSDAFLIDDSGYLAAQHPDGSLRIWSLLPTGRRQQHHSPYGRSYSQPSESDYYSRQQSGRTLARPKSPKSSRSKRMPSNGQQMID